MSLPSKQAPFGLLFHKEVDWSLFDDGTTIPIEVQQRFAAANQGSMPQPGEKRAVTLLIEGHEYHALLTHTVRKDRTGTLLQLRYDANRALSDLLRARLQRSYDHLSKERARLQEEKGTQAKVFADLPTEQAAYLDFYATGCPYRYRVEIIAEGAGTPVLDLQAIVKQFASALEDCGLHVGSGHLPFVRSFVASLATKRLIILTGLSGSGKTQIALRFGQWLGAGRHLLLAVRPDWTGPEPLLGYEDALAPVAADGARAWHAPEALRFMLQAAADPQHPYLLILDEMNLAHVERYFADVLSGMESGAPCLPNLYADGAVWRIPAGCPAKIALPPNLFVAGTVNVDETTYMFSPKVLDRANTLEFRVQSADLSAEARRPRDCSPGEAAYIAGFLAIAADAAYHLEHRPTHAEWFIEKIGILHTLLQEYDFEFGHRLFYEAVRYAAMLYAAGEARREEALDRQVLQKILPRLHGSRRRLEPLLCALGQFCFDPAYNPDAGESATRFDPLQPPAGAARLPCAFDKLRRMLRLLRANQYVSFNG